MDTPKQKPGPRPKDPAKKKLTKSLTLLPAEVQALEALALAAGLTPASAPAVLAAAQGLPG